MNSDRHFEIAKVGKTVLYAIQELHGDEGYKYALSLFTKIEENDTEIAKRKKENDKMYGILQRLSGIV